MTLAPANNSSRGGAGGAQEAGAVPAAASATIMLPLPPTANHMWMRSGRKIHLSPAYVAWKRVAGMMILAARIKPIPGRYQLTLDLPAKMRGDVDNRIKPANDILVLQRIVEDDRLCQRVIISRADDVPAKQCRIIVTAIQQEKEQ